MNESGSHPVALCLPSGLYRGVHVMTKPLDCYSNEEHCPVTCSNLCFALLFLNWFLQITAVGLKGMTYQSLPNIELLRHERLLCVRGYIFKSFKSKLC